MLSDISFCSLMVRMNSLHTAAVVPTVHPHHSWLGLAFFHHIFYFTFTFSQRHVAKKKKKCEQRDNYCLFFSSTSFNFCSIPFEVTPFPGI